jgi:hypothetical protein
MADAAAQLDGLITDKGLTEVIRNISRRIRATYGRRIPKDEVPGWVGLGVTHAAMRLDRHLLKADPVERTRQVMSWLLTKGFWETITVLRIAKVVDRKINGRVVCTTLKTVNASAVRCVDRRGDDVNVDFGDHESPPVDAGPAAKDFYEWAVTNLSHIQSEIIYYHYVCELPMYTIGKILSLSQARVSQIHAESIRLIRREADRGGAE